MREYIVGKNQTYKTISEVIERLDYSDDIKIIILSGIYNEKIKIVNKGKHRIIIEGIDNPIITYSDYAKKIHEDGLEFNTFRTASLMLIGDNYSLIGLTIKNEAGKGNVYGQAVALYITGNNNRIEKCRIIANQDTLFLGPLPKDLINRYQNFLREDELVYPKKHRIIINNSYIEGDVDFIFGSAEAYFIDCKFYSNGNGFVFAPSTDITDELGFVVINGKFSGKEGTSSYLARPWRDYGMVYIKDSIYENHIVDAGFDKWNNTSRDKTCRFFETNCAYADGHKYKRCDFIKKNNEEIGKKILLNCLIQDN